MSLKGSIRALVDSRPAYDEAEAYYEGQVDEVWASNRLKVLLGKVGRSFRINHARTPVDVMMERTEITAIESVNNVTREALQQVWDDNDLGLEAKDIHRRAYEFGDAYLIAWEDEELSGGVSAYAHSPQEVRVYYDPRRPRVKSHAVHAWLEDSDTDDAGGRYRCNVYYPDRVEQWMSSSDATDALGNVILVIQDAEWIPYADADGNEQGEIPNPWGVVPVFHFRTERPYGRPEHKDAYGPQNSINKAWATVMGLVDYHGAPQRWIATDSAINGGRPEEFGPEQFLNDDDTPETERQTLDDSSRIATGPAELWELSGVNVRVGEFSPADPSGLLNVIGEALKEMSAVTDIPVSRFNRASDSPSGESYRQEDKPLVNKIRDRQAQFGVVWAEFFDFCKLVKNISDEERTGVVWSPPTSYDDQDSWETGNLQIEAGVPRAQVLRERSYTDEQIEQWGVPEEYSKLQPVAVPGIAYDDPDTLDTNASQEDSADE